MTEWLSGHILITYVIIYTCIAYVYLKVFRMRKLPILKEAVIYLLLGVGALVLLLFQVDLRLPIVPCLFAAVALMLIVRVRTFFLDRSQQQQSKRS